METAGEMHRQRALVADSEFAAVVGLDAPVLHQLPVERGAAEIAGAFEILLSAEPVLPGVLDT